MRQDVFLVVGGFDSGMVQWGREDSEVGVRLWTLGHECIVVPDLEVAHRFRKERPHRVDWEPVLYNRLRLATVHRAGTRRERVAEGLKQHAALPAAPTPVQQRQHREFVFEPLSDSDKAAQLLRIHPKTLQRLAEIVRSTLLSQNSEDVKLVQELLRHANNRVTLDRMRKQVRARSRKHRANLRDCYSTRERNWPNWTMSEVAHSLQTAERNGGDDGTRTRGLCRDRIPPTSSRVLQQVA